MTREQVETAVQSVLGFEVHSALRQGQVSLSERLSMAALKAFREDWATDGTLDLIRGALMMLARDGQFSFEEYTADE